MKALDIFYEKGWYSEEQSPSGSFRWIQQTAMCFLKNLPTHGKRKLLIVGGHHFPQSRNPELKVFVNKKIAGHRKILPSTNSYIFPIEDNSETLEIQLELDNTFSTNITDDKRELGIMIEQVKVYTGEALNFPTTLELESSTYCNINPPCVMCYARIFDKRHYLGEIEEIAFQRMVPHFENFRTISLHGVGEPLLGKKLFTIIDNIDTDKTNVQFNSNGLLLTEEISRKLIQKGLKLIDFSLDASTATTYRKIRRSDFSLVIKNIQRLSEIKRELNVSHPVIMLNMTLMKENLSEAVPFIEMAKNLGAEIVHFGLLNPFKEYLVKNNDFLFNYKEQMINIGSDFFRKTIDQVEQKANELGITLSLEFSKFYV